MRIEAVRPPTKDQIAGVVAGLLSVPVPELFAGTRRTAATAVARSMAMYLAVVECGYSRQEAALHFGRDRTSVSSAIEQIERLRDDDPTMTIRINTALALLRRE